MHIFKEYDDYGDAGAAFLLCHLMRNDPHCPRVSHHGHWIYQNATGTSVSYIHYMAFAVPVGLLCFAAMLLLFRFVLRPDLSCVSRLDFDALKRSVTPLTAAKRQL